MNIIKRAAARLCKKIKQNPALSAKIAVFGTMLCICITYVGVICSYDVVTVAYADGVRLGVVSQTGDVYSAVSKAVGDASQITYPTPKTPNITFELCVTNGEVQPLTKDGVYNLMYENIISGYKQMYVMFVDGKFAAANPEKQVLCDITDAISESIYAQSNGEAIITSKIDIKQLYCDGAYALEDERIVTYLTNDLSYDVMLETGDNVLEFFFEEDSDKAMAPGILLPSAGAHLNTSVSGTEGEAEVKYVTVTEEIPYKTVYVPNNSLFEGVYVKKTDGASGLKTVTLEILYRDGKEVSRTAISEEVITPAVDKEVYEGAKLRPSTASTGKYIIPIKKGSYTVTDRYGDRELLGNHRFHSAIDLAANKGVTIMASDGGEVIKVSTTGSLGKCVVIRHDNGEQTSYAHMSKISVSVGDKVYQGQKIGEVGATGLATGYHLHFEIIVGGEKIDPEKYIAF